MADSVFRNRFFHDVLKVNQINDFSTWFFYTGMLFGSEDKWWGKGGERPGPHEGLDICFYKNNDGSLVKLEDPIRIPVMDDGVVFDISQDDFIASSIFVRHDYQDSNGHFLHSVYAHARPVDGLSPGQLVKHGEVVASMGDPARRDLSIPSHIHVSMVYLPEDYPRDKLKWQILALTYDARLVDPFGYLECGYALEPYTP